MAQFERYRPETVTQQLAAAAAAFGSGLRRWRISNGWSQNTPQDWGRAVGIAHVFNSQWSQLENARLRGPEPKLFIALGIMNELLASQNYGPIQDRGLRDTVAKGRPVLHEDGHPWDAGDFSAAFYGLLQWPEFAQPRPLISDDEAAQISAQVRDRFRSVCAAAKRRPGPAIRELLQLVPAEDQARMEDVLLGDNYSGAELSDLRDDDGRPLPQQWLEDWQSEPMAQRRAARNEAAASSNRASVA